ncbi:hypothetical protein BDN72DRAFT_472531 [Pluteus cervinus]|uniref:Uncharacterized protein n=1 Tax=Pluteus cervinus TaxID=181527 RepID=A0ACD3A678_9AGAR|nr:hypothetical protein BDN72DRAFT_472531 [Pluteus cervinus]
MHHLASMISIIIILGTGALSAPIIPRNDNGVSHEGGAQPAPQPHSYAAGPYSGEPTPADYKSELSLNSEAKTEHAISKESKSESLVEESREKDYTNLGKGAPNGVDRETKIEYAMQNNKTSEYTVQNANLTAHAVKEGHYTGPQSPHSGVDYELRHDSKNQTHIKDIVEADNIREDVSGEECNGDELHESYDGYKADNRTSTPQRLTRTNSAQAVDDNSDVSEEIVIDENLDNDKGDGPLEQVSTSTPLGDEDQRHDAPKLQSNTASNSHHEEELDEDSDDDGDDDDDDEDDDEDDDDEYERPMASPGYYPPPPHGGPLRAPGSGSVGAPINHAISPLSIVSLSSGGRMTRLKRSKVHGHGGRRGHKTRHQKHRHGRLVHDGYY